MTALVLANFIVPATLSAHARGSSVATPPPHNTVVAAPRTVDQIAARFREQCFGLDTSVDPDVLAKLVCDGLCNDATEEQVAELMAETAAYQASMHPDFGRLAARVAVARLHSRTQPGVLATLRALCEHRVGGVSTPLVNSELVANGEAMAHALEAAIQHERDYEFDYFGLRTLQRSYLLSSHEGNPIERPQHLLMRVALCVHGADTAAVLGAYDMMSRGLYTHATPTLFNAGAKRQQLSSCFLLTAKADSVDGIFDTLRQCALISRDAGGIGLSVSHIRASQSYIRSSGGKASGLVPMLRVFDATARYVDQGGGKRKGAFAIYLEPWHADVFAFLELKKNHGKEESRARDLFYALWVPDLFMRRVEAGGEWSLFCPDEAPGLADVYGKAFDELYERYEREGRAKRTVQAQQLWFKIVESQMETGTPYMLYKDACNSKSNQQHLGAIRGSNLCTEVVQFSSAAEVAVCNLASIALPRFVNEDGAGVFSFDHEGLRRVAAMVVKSLDRVISVTHYPLPEVRASR